MQNKPRQSPGCLCYRSAAFFNGNYLMKTYVLGAPSATHAVIVGAGIMGADVAVVLLRAQCRVTLVEPGAQAQATAGERIEENLRHVQSPGNRHRLEFCADLDAVPWSTVHLVIECIPELLAAKQALFARLEALAPPGVVLASNSSGFPISQIAQGCTSAQRMVGLHFFMPAHIVPLVEVVRGPATDSQLCDDLAHFMRRCGSVPIQVRKDVPGFIGNRLQHALAREAFSLIEQGVATPEDIDAAVRFGFGFRFLAAGPILQKEHAGIDTHARAAATIYPTLSNAMAPAPVLADKLLEGNIGMKSGRGFYVWDAANMAQEKARYAKALRDALAILADDLPPIEP
jgi:3-hydroxybutyryl-CoA dehydrogenase